MNPWLVTLAALVILIGVIGFLLWWYVLPPPLNLPSPSAARLPSRSGSDLSTGYGGAGESDWGDELHAINQAIHQDRPVAQLTHYEIEHLIRQLAIPDWLPPRLLERAAAEVNGQGELFAV